METKEMTKIELELSIGRYNKNHALAIKSLDKNQAGYFVLNFGHWNTEPMSITEAFYWLKGFRTARELVG